jgi:predicted nucleotidyltransferase
MQALLTRALLPIKHKLAKACIYGSVAQQTDTAASDIDLLLVGDGLSLSEVLQCLGDLESELGRKINPNCYTQQEFAIRQADPSSFVNKVLQKSVLDLLEEKFG